MTAFASTAIAESLVCNTADSRIKCSLRSRFKYQIIFYLHLMQDSDGLMAMHI